jgi:hypothetical protein
MLVVQYISSQFSLSFLVFRLMHLLVYRIIPSEGDGILKPTRAFFIRCFGLTAILGGIVDGC